MLCAVTITTKRQQRNALRWSARAGLVAKGALYAVLGLLALQVALGARTSSPDHSGALRSIARQPFGAALVAAVALGFAGYAVWRGYQAVRPAERESRLRRLAERLVFAGRAVLGGGLSGLAVRVLLDAGGGRAGEEHATAIVLRQPGGVAVVTLLGVAIVVAGLVLGWRGVSGRMMEDVARGLEGRERRLLARVGMVGMLARMVAYVLVGVFLVNAALEFDPEEGVGLDQALLTLANQPHGPVLLGLVAVGLLAYAAFCFVHARYVRLDAP